LNFCGRLVFLYAMFATSRNFVIAETIRIVRQSDFENQEFKLNGLKIELEIMMESDKNFLMPLINAKPDVKDPYCHVGCVIRNATNTLKEKDKWRFQETKITALDPDSGLNVFMTKDEKVFLCKYLAQLEIPCNFKQDKDYSDDICTKCYQKNNVCVPPTDKQKDTAEGITKWTEYSKDEDGICLACPQEEYDCRDCIKDLEWKGTSSACSTSNTCPSEKRTTMIECGDSGKTDTCKPCGQDGKCHGKGDPDGITSVMRDVTIEGFGLQCVTSFKRLCTSCKYDRTLACMTGKGIKKGKCKKHW